MIMYTVQFYDVKPFGKFPLSGCFDEAYISALMAFGINPAFYLMNESCGLGRNKQGIFFSLGKRRSFSDFEEALGIESLNYRVNGTIVQETIDKLQEGYLIITRVRGVSGTNIETGRKTQRSFSEHWILVYGYEPKSNKFIALEHNNNVSARYAPCEIDAKEYEDAYALAQKKEKFVEGDIYALRCKANADNATIDSELFKEFFASYNSEASDEQSNLEKFIQSADTTMVYISILNEVIKKYQKEQWIQDEMQMHISSIDTLLRELFLVRTYCVKAQFKGLTEPDDKLREHMSKAIECSQKYYADKKSIGVRRR